jgi:hypothetical protein
MDCFSVYYAEASIHLLWAFSYTPTVGNNLTVEVSFALYIPIDW